MDRLKWKSSVGRSVPWIVMLVLIMVAGETPAFAGLQIKLSASRVAQGDSVFVKILAQRGMEPRVSWMGRRVFLVPIEEDGTWGGFFGVDLQAKPGPAPLDVEVVPGGNEKRLEITIVKKDRGVRVLTLPKEMVELDPETLVRVRKESEIMRKALDAPPSAPAWIGDFLEPLSGRVIGVFGTRSIINGLKRSPHSGVDLKAGEGTPVHSINNGKVVLTAEQFFSGKSVVIDHGGAIQSMYFHLEKILVHQGERVKKGQIIGLVGSTGRATGPHLHFGVRINEARVDPVQFMALSEQMEQR
jgi:murein DD-endopeptidase MepM/ murein hydrolase activator NlpD